jgi:GxxExxY protein
VPESIGRLEPSKAADELAHAVIGAAIDVHRILGPGLLESMYERALGFELASKGIPFATQVELEGSYKGLPIGGARVDLLVGQVLIVELKSVDTLLSIHVAQTLSYLMLSGLELGLLINFNTVLLKAGIKRVVNTRASFNSYR